MLLQHRPAHCPFLEPCHLGTMLLIFPACSTWPHDHLTRSIKCTTLIVDCVPTEPDCKVSSVVAGGNCWMSIMTQSSLCCLVNHDCHSVKKAGRMISLDVSKPITASPDFPLTLFPWQQSPGSGTLNQDTWVLLISHVESLRYFPSPLYIVSSTPSSWFFWFVLIWDPGVLQQGGAPCVACPVVTQ